MKKNWTFQLEDGTSHTVRLEHGQFSGKREIYLDDKPVVKEKKIFDTGSSHSFPINDQTCTVVIKATGFGAKYDCLIGKRSVVTGKEVLPQLPLPGWAWVFIVACGIIPILTIGGAIPTILGVGGAFYCASVSRDSSKKTGTRVAVCLGTAIACWVLVLLVLGALSIFLRRFA